MQSIAIKRLISSVRLISELYVTPQVYIQRDARTVANRHQRTHLEQKQKQKSKVHNEISVMVYIFLLDFVIQKRNNTFSFFSIILTQYSQRVHSSLVLLYTQCSTSS